MKIRLIEDVHIEWCPAGTEGELIIENDFIHKFFPILFQKDVHGLMVFISVMQSMK